MYWPDPAQELLVRAALFAGPESLSAWREWNDRVDLNGTIDPGTFRLLPLAWHNLRLQGVDGPEMHRLRSVYRQSWYRTQVQLHRAAAVLERFRDAGIPTLVLKGLPLLLRYYREPGLRPMNDVDILVPSDRARESYERLKGWGWQACDELEQFLSRKHCALFRDAAGGEIDLHRNVLHEGQGPAADEDFWLRAEPIEVPVPGDPDGRTLETLTLSPADHLLHVCIHGTKPVGAPVVIWVADALTILRHDAGRIVWPELIRAAAGRTLGLRLRETLAGLADRFGAPVPPETLRELAAVRPTPFERAERCCFADRSPPGAPGARWYSLALRLSIFQRLDRSMSPAGHLLFRLGWAARPLVDRLTWVEERKKRWNVRYRQVPLRLFREALRHPVRLLSARKGGRSS